MEPRLRAIYNKGIAKGAEVHGNRGAWAQVVVGLVAQGVVRRAKITQLLQDAGLSVWMSKQAVKTAADGPALIKVDQYTLALKPTADAIPSYWKDATICRQLIRDRIEQGHEIDADLAAAARGFKLEGLLPHKE